MHLVEGPSNGAWPCISWCHLDQLEPGLQREHRLFKCFLDFGSELDLQSKYSLCTIPFSGGNGAFAGLQHSGIRKYDDLLAVPPNKAAASKIPSRSIELVHEFIGTYWIRGPFHPSSSDPTQMTRQGSSLLPPQVSAPNPSLPH